MLFMGRGEIIETRRRPRREPLLHVNVCACPLVGDSFETSAQMFMPIASRSQTLCDARAHPGEE